MIILCRYSYNPDQQDTDRDGIGDACDQKDTSSTGSAGVNLMPVYQLLLKKGR